MNIYQCPQIPQSILDNFQPTRLAIKELAGQLYFCKSIVEDIDSYPGSGVVWKCRIKKYGRKNVKTLWVSDWYIDPYEIQRVALGFSEENQVVESSKWANQKPENGLDGGAWAVCRWVGDLNPSVKTGGPNKGRFGKDNPLFGRKRPEHSELMTGSNNPDYDSAIFTFYNHSLGLVETCTKYELRTKYCVGSTGKMAGLTAGKIKSVNGWTMTSGGRVINKVCRLADRKEMDIGNFTIWARKQSLA